MRLAILTDIHANREAFEAVLADAALRAVDRFVFLGDIVGYGPDPGWCVDKMAEMMAAGAVAVRGNHDRAVGVADGALNSNARRVIDWTVDRLSAPQKLILGDLPMTHEEATFSSFMPAPMIRRTGFMSPMNPRRCRVSGCRRRG
jgi:predicted phosphodiesterase